MKKVKSISIAFFMLLLSFTAFSQQVNVRGNVRSSDGEPLFGTGVVQVGTTVGTITDENGNFSLNVPAGSTLEFSFIGFVTKVLRAAPQMDVVLEEDSKLLEEVVVTGYTTEKKADLTGAVTVVDMRAAEKMNVSNPMQALQGQIPGVSITAGGSPGATASVQIRGVGTVNGTAPLYVVDGVPTTSVGTMNPNDIESIQFLKDAASATIYGSRASNGVIIITTKKGKSGKVNITFNSSVAMSSYINQLDVLNAEEFGQALWRASVNDNFNPNQNGLGYSFDWSSDASGNPVLNKVNIAKYLDADNKTPSADTDWVKETTKIGIVQNYNLALSQGTDRGSSYFSLGYYGNQGIIKTSNFERLSVRMNSDYKLFKDRVTVGEHFTFSMGSGVGAPGSFLQSVLQFNPSMPIYTVDGEWAGPVNGYPDRENPLAILDRGKDNKSNNWRLFGDAYVNVNLFKGFNVKTTFGFDYTHRYGRDFTYPITEGNVANPRNGVSASFNNSLSWMWNAIATYAIDLGKSHFDFLAGTELNRDNTMQFEAYREDFALLNPNYMWPSAGTGAQTVSGSGGGYALVSFFGKINYNFANKYLLAFTIRRDGSSRFGRNNRYATFPAISAGWKIKNEPFLADVDWLSDLKLRASWGVTGNQNISNNARYTLYSSRYDSGANGGSYATSYDIGGTNGGKNLDSGFRRNSLGNDDLKWESTEQTNVGIDFGFLNDEIYGAFDVFFKHTKDILINMRGLDVMGEGHSMYMNAGEMKNRGMEFSLGYRHSFVSGLNLDIRGNISNYRSEITSLPSTVAANGTYGGNGVKNILGHAMGSQAGYIFGGIFQNDEDVKNHASQSGADPGRLIFNDIAGKTDENGNPIPDGKITNADQDWIYDPTPKFSYGLNITLRYKNFDFTTFWEGIHGLQIMTDLKKETDLWSGLNIGFLNKGARLLDAWTPENPSTTIPALTRSDSNNEKRRSSYYVEDGSFFRMRNAQIGYTLPSNIAKKIGLSRLRVYVSTQNAITFKSSKFTGVDPENPNFGYPIPMITTLSVNATF
jgi:TonB-linked SusC/RagA family outer membrane protein